jgi:hypothetical protein
MSAEETIALMRDAAPRATAVVLERIRATTVHDHIEHVVHWFVRPGRLDFDGV